MAVERTAGQLRAEHQAMKLRIDSLEDEVEESNRVISELNSKMKKADAIINNLERENERLKDDIEAL